MCGCKRCLRGGSGLSAGFPSDPIPDKRTSFATTRVPSHQQSFPESNLILSLLLTKATVADPMREHFRVPVSRS